MIQLEAPDDYWSTPAEELAEICNGVGPASWPAWIRAAMDSPAFCWGVSLRTAADIHDFEYHVGQDYAAKAKADKRFGRNCMALVRNHTPWWAFPLLLPRLHRTKQLYLAVRFGGSDAFWNGKQT